MSYISEDLRGRYEKLSNWFKRGGVENFTTPCELKTEHEYIERISRAESRELR